tara:strand:- start:110 stop:691 length:582 start_codon:yes stop_codon:yes gene_type:complete
MIFDEVKTLSDGRKYIKCETSRIKLKSIVLEDDFQADDNVTMQLTESTKDIVSQYDTEIIQAAQNNSEAWFGRKLSDKKISSVYTPGVTEDGVMACEKARERGTVMVRAFNKDQTAVQLDDVRKGMTCHVCIELLGVMIYQKNFTPLWKVVQVMIVPTPKTIRHSRYTDECMFDEEDMQDMPDVSGGESDDEP